MPAHAGHGYTRDAHTVHTAHAAVHSHCTRRRGTHDTRARKSTHTQQTQTDGARERGTQTHRNVSPSLSLVRSTDNVCVQQQKRRNMTRTETTSRKNHQNTHALDTTSDKTINRTHARARFLCAQKKQGCFLLLNSRTRLQQVFFDTSCYVKMHDPTRVFLSFFLFFRFRPGGICFPPPVERQTQTQ